jgi:tRNA G18 (ribose-2'-O)-methylase SpoU
MAATPAGIAELQAAGATVVALSPGGDTTCARWLARRSAPGPVVVIAGAEGPGLGDAALAAADVRATIPMPAAVDSLNVATAVAIALFQLRG